MKPKDGRTKSEDKGNQRGRPSFTSRAEGQNEGKNEQQMGRTVPGDRDVKVGGLQASDARRVDDLYSWSKDML